MKRYTVTVPCRGCQHQITLGFIAPKTFCERAFPAVCGECQSEIRIEIRQPHSKKQIMARCQMVKHSKKLERLLKLKALKQTVKSFFGVGHA